MYVAQEKIDNTFRIGDLYQKNKPTNYDCKALSQCTSGTCTRPIIIRGYKGSGKSCLIDTFGLKYAKSQVKIVVDGRNEPGRYTWAHVKSTCNSGISQYSRLECLIEADETVNLSSVLSVLADEINIRKQHYFQDKTLPLQDIIEVFFIEPDLSNIELREFLDEYRSSVNSLKIRLYFTVSNESDYDVLKDSFNNTHIMILLGEMAESMIQEMSIQHSRLESHIAKGLVFYEDGKPYVFCREMPQALWVDGEYKLVHTGLLNWNERLFYSDTVIPGKKPQIPRLNPDRRRSLNLNEGIFSEFSELFSEDDLYEVKIDYATKQERHIPYDYRDNLDDVITNCSERLELAGLGHLDNMVLNFCFDYVHRSYINHTQLQPKAVDWFNQNRSVFLELCSFTRQLEGVRDFLTCFSIKNLSEKRVGTLKETLVRSNYPSSKEGLTSLLKLKSLMCMLFPQIVSYLENRQKVI